MAKRKKRLATLTDKEDRAWVDFFNHNLTEGLSDRDADERAWVDMKRVFPRLKKFDGCRADVSKD